jgi:hypothetical protein
MMLRCQILFGNLIYADAPFLNNSEKLSVFAFSGNIFKNYP